jgi:hypothetical protein
VTALSDRIAAVHGAGLRSFVVEIDLSVRFRAGRMSASGRTATLDKTSVQIERVTSVIVFFRRSG